MSTLSALQEQDRIIASLKAELARGCLIVDRLNDTIDAQAKKIAELTAVLDERGIATGLIREHFRMVDPALVSFGIGGIFSMRELFEVWVAKAGIEEDGTNVLRNTMSQLQIMLVRNNIITKTGSRLYRVHPKYMFTLTNAFGVSWKTDTYLEPKSVNEVTGMVEKA